MILAGLERAAARSLDGRSPTGWRRGLTTWCRGIAAVIQPPGQTPSLSPPAPTLGAQETACWIPPSPSARPPQIGRRKSPRSPIIRQVARQSIRVVSSDEKCWHFAVHLSCWQPAKEKPLQLWRSSRPPVGRQKGSITLPRKVQAGARTCRPAPSKCALSRISNNHRFSRKSRRSACPAPWVHHRRSTSS